MWQQACNAEKMKTLEGVVGGDATAAIAKDKCSATGLLHSCGKWIATYGLNPVGMLFTTQEVMDGADTTKRRAHDLLIVWRGFGWIAEVGRRGGKVLYRWNDIDEDDDNKAEDFSVQLVENFETEYCGRDVPVKNYRSGLRLEALARIVRHKKGVLPADYFRRDRRFYDIKNVLYAFSRQKQSTASPVLTERAIHIIETQPPVFVQSTMDRHFVSPTRRSKRKRCATPKAEAAARSRSRLGPRAKTSLRFADVCQQRIVAIHQSLPAQPALWSSQDFWSDFVQHYDWNDDPLGMDDDASFFELN